MNEMFTDNGVSYMIRETPFVRRADREAFNLTERNGVYSIKRTAPMNWDMSNTLRRTTKNGTEVDALARRCKPGYLWGVPGIRAWVKRQMRRRERREGKAEAREAGDG